MHGENRRVGARALCYDMGRPRKRGRRSGAGAKINVGVITAVIVGVGKTVKL